MVIRNRFASCVGLGPSITVRESSADLCGAARSRQPDGPARRFTLYRECGPALIPTEA